MTVQWVCTPLLCTCRTVRAQCTFFTHRKGLRIAPTTSSRQQLTVVVQPLIRPCFFRSRNACLSRSKTVEKQNLVWQVCIAASDYEAAGIVVDLMAAVNLQPEPEQEKRMQQACFGPGARLDRQNDAMARDMQYLREERWEGQR